MRRLNDKGSALVLVVFTMLIVFFLGFALLEVSTIDFAMANNQVDGVKAYYIAEAGMNKAIAKLSTDQTLLNETLLLTEGQSMEVLNEEDFAGGIFFGGYADIGRTIKIPVTLTVQEYVPNEYLIVQISTTGRYHKAEKDLKARLKLVLLQQLSPLSPTSAIISDGTTKNENNSIVNGDIFSRGAVELKNNSIVNGSITSGSSVIKNKATVSGTISANNPNGVPIFPDATPELYKEGAIILGNDAPSYWSISFNSLTSGKYYVSDHIINLSISGTYNGDITLISKGTIEIENNVTAANGDYENNSLSLISFSNITINNNCIIEGVLLCASDGGTSGSIIFGNNSDVKGAIMAKNVLVSNNAEITAESSLISQFTGYSAGFALGPKAETVDVIYWY